jgi:hypothetical protein
VARHGARGRIGVSDDGRLPTFVVIGAMRSGTTSLTHWLRGHPDVHMAGQKEVHFFDLHFDQGVAWYRQQFAEAGKARAVGEATPAYMASGPAVTRMAATIPDALLVVLLRNPVDRAYSHYWHNRLLGKEQREFSEALADPGAGPDYLGRGRYVDQLRRVTDHFARSSLHVMLHDDMVTAPAPTFAELCRFLGVDPTVQPGRVGTVVNAATAFRSLRVRRATRGWPKPVRNAVGRLNTRPFTYPPLRDDEAAVLERRMAEPNRELAEFLGRDLSLWQRRAESRST